MSYPVFLEPLRDYLPYTAFIMAAFSALRLAKFNLDERQALGFIGLPTPANALFWGSLLVGVGEKLETRPWALYFILAGILISSWLLVSEIPMFALKFKQRGEVPLLDYLLSIGYYLWYLSICYHHCMVCDTVSYRKTIPNTTVRGISSKLCQLLLLF